MRVKKTLAVLAAISLTTVGCAKETVSQPDQVTSQQGVQSESENNGEDDKTETMEEIVQSVFEWKIEPFVEADNILVPDLDAKDSYYPYVAAEEVAIVEKDGKYGLIRYDGSYIAQPEYGSYHSLGSAGQLMEVYDDTLGSIQVYNGVYDIDIQYDGDYGWGYMSSNYYAVDGLEKVIAVWESPDDYQDGASLGSYLENYEYEDRSFVIVQKAEGFQDENGLPWVYEDTTEEAYGIGTREGIIVPCEYTGGMIPESKSTTVAALEKNGKWGYFNEQGECIIDFICEPTIYQQLVEEYDFYTIDSAAYQCYHAGEGVPYMPTDGLIAVRTEDGYGYFDLEGNEIIPVGTFEEARPFHNGMAWVMDSDTGLWGIIQLPGSEEPDLDEPAVHYLGTDFSTLQSGGLIAENEDMVIYLAYTEASVFDVNFYNNQRTAYTGRIWKYDKHEGTASTILGGTGWDSIFSYTQSDYPVENINISEDGMVYLSSYEGDSSTTRIYELNSETGEYTEIYTIYGNIQNMVLIDGALYIAEEQRIIAYDLQKESYQVIAQLDGYDWNIRLLNFYGNCLYYSYGTYDEEQDRYPTMLGIYNIVSRKTDITDMMKLSNDSYEKVAWTNIYPGKDTLISFDYDYISEYSLVDKTVRTYDNPYRTLPDSFPPYPAALISLEDAYYLYTGNLDSYYSDDYHIVKMAKDFSSVEDLGGVFSMFEATDGSTFIERCFTFGKAEDAVWVASDGIVRKYTSDGSRETIYKK